MAEFRLETARLVLREWRAADAAAHNALCNTPEVAAALGAKPTLEQSREVVARQQGLQREFGYCFWVLESGERPGFAGWCGIKPGKPPIEGQPEIGWTLDPALWGQGLITEAARLAVGWGWSNTAWPEIVAITSRGNQRSRRVMERIGMDYRPDGDFAHPDLAASDPLLHHVLYRLARPR